MNDTEKPDMETESCFHNFAAPVVTVEAFANFYYTLLFTTQNHRNHRQRHRHQKKK